MADFVLEHCELYSLLHIGLKMAHLVIVITGPYVPNLSFLQLPIFELPACTLHMQMDRQSNAYCLSCE